jgi:putative component of membrane protein insertase Oxa1/YidC/SpoIIIJ protein YidD
MVPLDRCILFWFLLFGILYLNQAQATDGMRSPDLGVTKRRVEPDHQSSIVSLTAQTAIKFYSSVISPADGPRSPSYPTGSAYGLAAVRQHGFLMGILLIGDRLFHEADLHQGPVIYLHGKKRYYDPVESNTFWWSETGH